MHLLPDGLQTIGWHASLSIIIVISKHFFGRPMNSLMIVAGEQLQGSAGKHS